MTLMNEKEREAGAQVIHELVQDIVINIVGALVQMVHAVNDEKTREAVYSYMGKLSNLCVEWDAASDEVKAAAYEEFDTIVKKVNEGIGDE